MGRGNKDADRTNGDIRLLQGSEACVHGALLVGVSFLGRYHPITPSTEVARDKPENPL